MNSFYSFPYYKPSTNSKYLITFYPGSCLKIKDQMDLIRLQYKNRPAYESVIVIAPISCQPNIKEYIAGNDVKSELCDATNLASPPGFLFAFFDESYNFSFFDVIGKLSSSVDKNEMDRIHLFGCIEIFVERNLVVEASNNYHFKKPSGKHSDRFIRASNVLQSGAEINFLALKLLPFLKADTKHVFVDTSGISSLVLSAINIKNSITGRREHILVDSYGSYSGVDKYNFGVSGRPLIVISASTSNDLYKKIKKTPDLFSGDIVSVFYNSSSACGHAVLFDFSKIKKHLNQKDPYFHKFSSIDSFPEESCNYCAGDSSVPISLGDDQFLVEHPKIEVYLPRAIDNSKLITDRIRFYLEAGALRCFYDGLDGRKPGIEFFVDVKKMIESSDKFIERLKSTCYRSLPAWVDTIFYCSDAGAKELAKKVAEYYSSELSIKISTRPATEIESLPKSEVKKGIVVIAASFESGKTLLNVSRSLRRFSPLPITYLTGFLKYNDKNSLDKIVSDLTYSESSFGKHHFFAVEKLQLPVSEQRENAWECEKRLLVHIRNFCKENNYDTSKFDERFKFLVATNTQTRCGDEDDIFWKSPKGEALQLRDSFAFWPDDLYKGAFKHQAPVYYTISAVMQRLRHNPKGYNDSPLEDSYIIRQLDPLAFDRYNDGIIQASFLRCAKPKEINYASDSWRSDFVKTLIQRSIERLDGLESESEALYEFLIALAGKRLTIRKDHLSELSKLREKIDRSSYGEVFVLLHYIDAVLISGNKPGIEL